MNTLFAIEDQPGIIERNDITIRLSGASIEVIFDTKVDPAFEKQFTRILYANVRGIDTITTSNRYEENTRVKIKITAYGLTRLTDMRAEIKAIAHHHMNNVQDIPVQSTLF